MEQVELFLVIVVVVVEILVYIHTCCVLYISMCGWQLQIGFSDGGTGEVSDEARHAVQESGHFTQQTQRGE